MGDFGTGANHNKLHTNLYYEKVNLLIEKAFYMNGDEEENVRAMLKMNGNMLEQDLF